MSGRDELIIEKIDAFFTFWSDMLFLMRNRTKYKAVALEEETRIVPMADYRLLKAVHVCIGQGGVFIIQPISPDDHTAGYANARAMCKYFDLDQHEVLDVTGYWVEG